MRALIISLFSLLFIGTAQAADIVCSCQAPDECSDIRISFVPAAPGVYMTIEYAYGEKNTEGFAQVTRDSAANQVIYKLGNFVLKEENGAYTLPFKQQVCS